MLNAPMDIITLTERREELSSAIDTLSSPVDRIKILRKLVSERLNDYKDEFKRITRLSPVPKVGLALGTALVAPLAITGATTSIMLVAPAFIGGLIGVASVNFYLQRRSILRDIKEEFKEYAILSKSKDSEFIAQTDLTECYEKSISNLIEHKKYQLYQISEQIDAFMKQSPHISAVPQVVIEPQLNAIHELNINKVSKELVDLLDLEEKEALHEAMKTEEKEAKASMQSAILGGLLF